MQRWEELITVGTKADLACSSGTNLWTKTICSLPAKAKGNAVVSNNTFFLHFLKRMLIEGVRQHQGRIADWYQGVRGYDSVIYAYKEQHICHIS